MWDRLQCRESECVFQLMLLFDIMSLIDWQIIIQTSIYSFNGNDLHRNESNRKHYDVIICIYTFDANIELNVLHCDAFIKFLYSAQIRTYERDRKKPIDDAYFQHARFALSFLLCVPVTAWLFVNKN